MQSAEGFVEVSLSSKEAFNSVLEALEDTIFKVVDVDSKKLVIECKTSMRFAKNTWGEKIKILIENDKKKNAMIAINSWNSTGSPKVHRGNVTEISDLISDHVTKNKKGNIVDSGFMNAAKAGAVATTTTWFAVETVDESNEEEGDDGSSFDFDD